MPGILDILVNPPARKPEPIDLNFWKLDHTTQCVLWGAAFERGELSKADEERIARSAYDVLERMYAEQLDAKEMLSESTKEQYKASCKKFVAFCQQVSVDDKVRINPMPARPGIVAAFLH
jgi:hypothetical protein